MHSQKQSPASKRIKKKILEYLDIHPLISFDEIYRKGNITKDWNDLHQNFLELKKAGQIKFLSFMKKYHKEPLPEEFRKYILIFKEFEEIFTLIRNDANGIERKFLQEFTKFQGIDDIFHIHKSRIKKSPMNYNNGVDFYSFSEQMFSKFFKLLMIECNNFKIDMGLPKLKNTIPRPLILPYDHWEILKGLAKSFREFVEQASYPEIILRWKFSSLEKAVDEQYSYAEQYYYQAIHRLSPEKRQQLINEPEYYFDSQLSSKYNISKKHVAVIRKKR